MANVMLLGTDRDRAGGVQTLLRKDGHHVTHVKTVDRWRTLERETLPELIVAAVDSTDGVISVPGRPVRGFPAPLLFVQHEADFRRDVHLDDRLVDRIASPFLSEDLLARVDALVKVRRVIHRDPAVREAEAGGAAGQSRRLAGLGTRVGEWLSQRFPRFEKPLGPYLEVAARVADWADRRDAFEPGHAERVTAFCAMIAEALGINDQETSTLLRAAMLHDIGKVAMPVEVLHQRTPLQESQMRLIRTHPKRGAALLGALDREDEISETILCHHERPDGQGYYRTEWDQVPRSARILAVSEVFDAMTSCKIKAPMTSSQALDRLAEARGESLDPDCVDALTDKLRPRPTTIPLATQPRYV